MAFSYSEEKSSPKRAGARRCRGLYFYTLPVITRRVSHVGSSGELSPAEALPQVCAGPGFHILRLCLAPVGSDRDQGAMEVRSDPEYILKVERRGFADGLGCEN